MTNLPTDPALTGKSSSPTSQANLPQQISVSGGNKEIVGGGSLVTSEVLLKAVGQEVELPKEVVEAGVRVEKPSAELPPAVQQMGVVPVGNAVPVQNVQASPVPLTDQQIADGLKQGVENSFRWLAEWCTRRLLQVHKSVKNVHGKFIASN